VAKSLHDLDFVNGVSETVFFNEGLLAHNLQRESLTRLSMKHLIHLSKSTLAKKFDELEILELDLGD